MKENVNTKTKSSTVLCLNCGKILNESWSYCPYCKGSTNDRQKCPQCDNEISPEWKFCPLCQAAVKGVKVEQQVFLDSNEWLRAVLKL